MLALLLVVAVAGCATDEPGPTRSRASTPAETASVTPSPAVSPSPSPEPAPSPTEIAVEPPGGLSAPGVLKVGPAGTALASAPAGAAAGRLRAGVLVPFTTVENGWARVTTPCELNRWMPVDS